MSFAAEIFSTKAVPGSVKAELDARANSKFKSGMSGQKTWCHIMSMADGNSYPISTYKTFSEAYPTANRPNILVQSLDVKSHGEYGTMRRASVKLKVFTDASMEALSAAYFIPNMSVRLQFGWSTGIKASPSQPITGTMSDGNANKAIRAQSQSTPTYDGFQGRVVSWEFSLADDQSWDVTLDLVGAAAAVANIPVNDESTSCYCEQKSPAQPTPGGDAPPEDDEEAKTKTSALQSALIRLIDDPGQAGALASELGIKGGVFVSKLKFNGYERDQAGTEDTSAPWYTFGFGDPSVGTEESFINFGSFCKLVERTCAQPWSSNGRPTILEIDIDNIDVSNYGFSLWSADPRVCALQGSPYSLEGGGISYDGKLNNIYLNCIHALRVTKNLRDQDDGVITLLSSILRDINNVCGNGWEFDFIDVSDKGSTGVPTGTRITIVDLNLYKSGDGAYEFKSGVNGKSNVRAVEMSLKPTEAMKTMALYSNASKDKSPASVQGCSDRFIRYAEAGSIVNLADDKGGGEKPKPCGGDKCSKEPEAQDDPLTALQKEVNDKTVASAKSYQVEQRKGKDDDVCNKAVMPFQLSMTVTGIGGFGFGQLVTLDRLPGTLKSKINYQVTAVEHSITPDDWTTKINTVGRLK